MKLYKFLRKGISHQKRNIECQDVIGDLYMPLEERLILALSDGAGSAKYAKEAAKENVQTILQFFSQISIDSFLKYSEVEQKEIVIKECLKNIEKVARKKIDEQKVRKILRGEFSATLLFVVIEKDKILCAHLGDGAIYMTNEDGKANYCSNPENQEQNSRRTYFTVSDDAVLHLRLDVINILEEKSQMLIMMSDGPQMMFYDRGYGNPMVTAEEIAPFLVLNKVETDEEFGKLLDVMTEAEIEKLDDWSVMAVVFNKKVKERKPKKIKIQRIRIKKYIFI